MMKRVFPLGLTLAFLMTPLGVANAKFTCDVEKIEGTSLILKNCQKKGLKRLKPGDTVKITRKRKPKVEGC